MTMTNNERVKMYVSEFGHRDAVLVDGWGFAERLTDGDDFVDSGYRGSNYRISTSNANVPTYPINLEITGRKIRFMKEGKWVRVRVEFVADGEESSFSGGYLLVK